MTVVHSLKSVRLHATPPIHYLPDEHGIEVPKGKTRWTLRIDQRHIPTSAEYEVHGEFHYPEGWQHDGGAVLNGGEYTPKNTGRPTSINFTSGTIKRMEPYPDRMRIAVHSFGHWPVPTAAVTFS